MTSDYFASQDLAQDTFLEAWKHLDEIEKGREKGWLATTASNKCIDYLRRSERKNMPMEEMAQEQAKDDIEQAYIDKDVRKQLEQNCRRLKEPYGTVAYMYFYMEKTPKEIAGQLGEKEASVRSRIYRAREHLRVIYGQEARERRDRSG